MSFERQDQIFGALQRPQEMKGTEEKPRESNKGQHRLSEERKKALSQTLKDIWMSRIP